LKARNMNGFAGLDRMEALAYEIEVGDAVDFLIIRNAERAVTEPHLCPDIDLGPLTALRASAAEAQARRPSIASEWPRDLPPHRNRGRRPPLRHGRTADKAQQKYCDTSQNDAASHLPPLSGLLKSRGGPGFAGQAEDVQARIGAVHNVDVAAIIGLDIIRLGR